MDYRQFNKLQLSDLDAFKLYSESDKRSGEEVKLSVAWSSGARIKMSEGDTQDCGIVVGLKGGGVLVELRRFTDGRREKYVLPPEAIWNAVVKAIEEYELVITKFEKRLNDEREN